MKSSLLLRLTALRLKPAAMAEVCAIIDEIEAPIEARKAKDRDRKSKESPGKIRGNSTENPRTVHGTSTPISTENPQPVSLEPSIDKKDSFFLTSSDSTLEKKEEVGVTRASKSRANKGQTVPADMQLSVKNLDFALSEGWPRERAFREWGRFRDGSISKGRLYKNIDAGWRNWVTSPYQKETPAGKFNLMSGIDGVI